MATIIFGAEFNLKLSPKQNFFTDNSDYTGQGINPNDITGSFQAKINGQIFYDNLANYQSNTFADIVLSSSSTNATLIQLPLNPDGTVVQGTYTVLYQVWDSNNSTTSTVTETFVFTYASPTVVVSGSVDVNTPLLTEYDNTVYVVNSVTPSPLTRVATITYPPILINNVLTTPTPTVGSTAITTSNLFYAPTVVTMSVVTNLTYTFSNFQVVDKVSGEIPFCIDATGLCRLVCGLNNFYNLVESNPNDCELEETFCYLCSLYILIVGLQGCGKGKFISRLIREMNNTAGFSDYCNACNDSVQQVVGIGGLVNAYNNINLDGYINISNVISGNTNTFTYALAPSFVDLVNSILGATLLAGDNIVLSSSTSGANTTWTINALGTTVISNNGSVLVTGTTTGNNTEYNLSIVPYSATKLTETELDTISTDYAIFDTPIQVGFAGSYMMWFEADFKSTNTLDVDAIYYPYKNSTPTVNISAFGNTDFRQITRTFADSATTTKITMNTVVSLGRNDTVNININATTLSRRAYIEKASILLIKIG